MDASRSRVDIWRTTGLVAGLLIWGLFTPVVVLGVAAAYAVGSVVAGILLRRQPELTRHGLAAAGVAVVLVVVEWLFG